MFVKNLQKDADRATSKCKLHIQKEGEMHGEAEGDKTFVVMALLTWPSSQVTTDDTDACAPRHWLAQHVIYDDDPWSKSTENMGWAPIWKDNDVVSE